MKPALTLAGLLAAPLLALAAAPAAPSDSNWPEFRGPRGDGSTTSRLPLTWSETSHVKWKTAISGKGWSSPVIWGNQIWLTTAPEDGKQLSVLCLDRDSGKILREQKLFDVATPQFVHAFNSHASPTPAIEEGRVYVTFGAPGTACLDTATGKVLWERRDLECNHFRGAGSSPIIWNDLLFLNFDGSDHQFMVALDKRTGKTVWRRERSIDFKDLGADGKPRADGDYRKAFATCHVADLGGVTTLLSQGANALYAYDPRTGGELWRVEERTSHSAAMRPVLGHGLIYVTTGYSQGQTLALRPGRRGEVLDANADAPAGSQLSVAWRSKRATPKKPALTLVGERLFAVDDNGVASCWNARTGEAIWSERLGGNFSASPLAAGSRLYCFNETGKCVVVSTEGAFAKLAENQLAAGCLASPAVSGNALFVRTKTHLYRIEE
jgi:outer membrane protein assembly factor BamB